MGIQYIKNKRLWDEQQKKISKLVGKPYESLSIQDKLEIAYDKYFKHEKISYAEYELMVLYTSIQVRSIQPQQIRKRYPQENTSR